MNNQSISALLIAGVLHVALLGGPIVIQHLRTPAPVAPAVDALDIPLRLGGGLDGALYAEHQ